MGWKLLILHNKSLDNAKLTPIRAETRFEGAAALVRPEEARRALETALLIEEAAKRGVPAARKVEAPIGVALSA